MSFLPIIGRIAGNTKTPIDKLVKGALGRAFSPGGAPGGGGRGPGKYVFGVKEQLLRFALLEKLAKEGFEEILDETAKYILEESKKITPVEHGDLKKSGYTAQVRSGDNPEFVAGFSAPYALYVHEQIAMKLQGQKRRGPGRIGRYWDPQGVASARYLARIIDEKRPAMKRRITISWNKKMKLIESVRR